MANSATLAIRIISDATKAAKGFQQVESAGDRMGKRLDKASRVAAGGLATLVGVGITAAKNAASDADAQALLAKAMRNVSQGTKAQVAQMEKYISTVSAATGVSDDQLRPALATLVRATSSAKQSQKELNAALDVSAATGKPVEQVANAIAKAHSGQTTALARLVPGIDKAALKSKNMNKIMAELARTTGGDAATAANTAEGKVHRMSLSFDEASESLGTILIPILAVLATTLASVGTWVQNNTKAVQIAAVVLAGLAIAVITVNTAYKLYTTYTRAAVAAQWLFNAAMSANPIALVVIALIALGAAFVIAYKKSATFRAIVQAVGSAGKAAIGWVVDKVRELVSKLGGLGPAATKAKNLAVGAFKLYTAPIRGVIKLVTSLVGWIKKIHFPSIPKGLSKLAGAVGLGGAPAGVARTVAAASSFGGRGGPSSSGSFLSTMSRRSAGVTLLVNFYGPVDANESARAISKILRRRRVRLGTPL